MTVLLREDHSMPLVAIDLWIETGSAEDPPGAGGVAHLLEHMLFKGTTTRAGDGVDEAIEDLGASLAASTLKDGSHLYTTVASRYYPDALGLIADMVLHATLPAAEMRREQGVIADEIATARADPVRRAAEALAAYAYGDHPYGRSIPGDPARLPTVSPQALSDARKRLLVGGNLALVMVGDFEPRAALATARRFFGPAPPGEVHRARLDPVAWRGRGGPVKEIALPGESAYLAVGFPGPSIADPQAIAATDVLSAVLDGDDGRLARALVGPGLARRVVADFLTQRGPGLLTLIIECRPDRLDRVREAVDSELAAILNAPLDASDIAAAKRRILSAIAFDAETYAGQAALLGFYQTLGRVDLASRYGDLVSAVTSDDLHRAARELLPPANAIRLIARPEVSEESPLRPGHPVIVPLPESDQG